ncbi:thiol:disulfide interchange protein DsbA/DsbL [Massilia sp. CF038]|uniref:thiol:disulfide interchange protein DsbA/DsbL n=1 Tax=Massilia sp. CF038 TaxID=1881045 RepID=UPI000912D7FB|nr:thiol:disulfide interchange protein DsbA/DsbL [Massilia sp. CF038]SHH29394.1 Thiol:disulfide interchange protein DsbA [Massilia sp. CF038]
MRLLHKLLLCLTFCLSCGVAMGSPSAPQAGTDYTVLPAPLATSAAPGKVEVIEFFSYACPHCRAFEPALAAWVKKNADKVSFRRVHVAFRPAEQPLQRLYTTLEAMGLTESMHAKIFAAVQDEHQHLSSEQAVLAWVAKAGIDAAKFEATWRSFGMPSRVSAAQASVAAFDVDLWPSIGIDGRFYTSPSKVAEGAGKSVQTVEQQHQAGLTVMDFLVAQAKAAKK